jgi:hypothetical protein
MKNVFKFSLVLAVALLTSKGFANAIDFSLSINKDKGKFITFEINETTPVVLSICDTEGKMIYSENVDPEIFLNRTYDFNTLPEGTYYLIADSVFKTSKYQISVVGTTASLSENPVSEEFKPIFKEDRGLVKLNFLNINSLPTFVKIYDKEDNLVYESNTLTDQILAMVFNVEEIQNETYTFVLSNNDRTFTKKFIKE